jgi:uncharacterized coiled-coil DUF342 family protein
MRHMLLLALPLIHAYSLGNGVTPVQKVIAMLQDMRSKGVAEKQSEQVRFAAYKQFCEDTTVEKKASIAEAAEEIEQLQADIQKAESDAANLAVDIMALDKDMAKWTSESETATAIRKKEKEDFAKTHKDYTESLDQLERAIIALKAADVDRPQTEMLIQKVASIDRVPLKARKQLAAFLSMGTVQTPAAKGYEFQGEGVLAMLGDMKAKFEDERMQLEKDEMGAEHAYQLVMMELKNSVETADKTRGEKAKLKAGREEAAAAAKGDLADTVASKDEDQAYLAALDAQCSQKSSDFEARQQLRSEELEAIDKAIEVVASPDLAGSAEKHITAGYSASSMGLRGGETHPPAQRQIAAFLQARAAKLDSHVLSALAIRVGENPFANVKKLIEDMINKLLEEANEESDHKGWCDTEMVKNKQTRESKTEDIDAMHAKVDKLEASISSLAQEIADLEASLVEINKAVAEALEVRGEETKKNKETIEDCVAAQTATSQALAVLKTFYDKAATATALVQTKGKQPEIDAPPTFEKPYTGMAGGGVMGLLEVIGSDFARLEAETETSEEESSKAHGRFMAESSKDKAVKAADLDHKKKSKVEAESDLQDTTADLKGTETELDAALVYYEKLKPSCQDKVVTYGDRVSQRQDEISALKEALTILSA